MLDAKAAASQFLRAARGKRSQVAFARRLGYRGNPITDWEHGRRFPTAAEALRACARAGIDVRAGLVRFHPAAQPPGAGQGELDGEALAGWLAQLRGSTPLSEIGRRCDCSRFAVARWLSGQAQPRLPDFFVLIDAITGRLPDLVAELVPIAAVPALLPRHRAAASAKRLAFEEPWTEAVLRLLETTGYASRAAHEPDYVAQRLQLSPEHAQRCLDRLEHAGIVRRDSRGRYLVAGALNVDTHADPEAVRRLMAHWSEVALSHFSRGHETNLFAYNVLSISQQDLLRVRELLRSTYREVRAIVAASEPSETAALLNLQLIEWSESEAQS